MIFVKSSNPFSHVSLTKNIKFDYVDFLTRLFVVLFHLIAYAY